MKVPSYTTVSVVPFPRASSWSGFRADEYFVLVGLTNYLT